MEFPDQWPEDLRIWKEKPDIVRDLVYAGFAICMPR
jgi:hypothetical protein